MRKNQRAKTYTDANGYLRYRDSYLDDDEWLAGQLEDDLTHYLQEKLASLAAKGIPYSRLNQRILKYWVVTAIGQNNWEKFPLEDQRAFIRMAQGMAFDMLGR